MGATLHSLSATTRVWPQLVWFGDHFPTHLGPGPTAAKPKVPLLGGQGSARTASWGFRLPSGHPRAAACQGGGHHTASRGAVQLPGRQGGFGDTRTGSGTPVPFSAPFTLSAKPACQSDLWSLCFSALSSSPFSCPLIFCRRHTASLPVQNPSTAPPLPRGQMKQLGV